MTRRWLFAFLIFVAVGAAAFFLPPPLTVVMLAGGVAVLAALLAPEAVIAVLLLVRSSADGFMELFTLFAGSPLSMNLAGALNSLAVGLGLLVIARRLVRWWHRGEASCGNGSAAKAFPGDALLAAAPGWTYAAFLLVGLLSIPGSVDVTAGVKEWARLASGLAIYLMVADVVHDERKAQRFLAVIFASSLVPLFIAGVQRLTGGGYFFLGFIGTEFAFRPQGTFAHPAALGSYLVILLTLAASLYFITASTWLRVALLAWAGAAGGVLALTLARTQWLGMMVAALVVGLAKRRRMALLALSVALLLIATVPLLRERLTASESVDWRLELWQAAASLAWPPTALGRGLATSPWYINQLLPKVDVPPHNDYLKVGIELGWLGWLAYGAWLVALAGHAWWAYRRAQEQTIAWRGLALLAVVLAGVVMSLSDNYLGYTAVQWYFWALVALVPADGQWPSRSLGSQHRHCT